LQAAFVKDALLIRAVKDTVTINTVVFVGKDTKNQGANAFVSTIK